MRRSPRTASPSEARGSPGIRVEIGPIRDGIAGPLAAEWDTTANGCEWDAAELRGSCC